MFFAPCQASRDGGEAGVPTVSGITVSVAADGRGGVIEESNEGDRQHQHYSCTHTPVRSCRPHGVILHAPTRTLHRYLSSSSSHSLPALPHQSFPHAPPITPACHTASCFPASCLSASCLSASCLSASCLSASCLSASCLSASCLSASCSPASTPILLQHRRWIWSGAAETATRVSATLPKTVRVSHHWMSLSAIS